MYIYGFKQNKAIKNQHNNHPHHSTKEAVTKCTKEKKNQAKETILLI